MFAIILIAFAAILLLAGLLGATLAKLRLAQLRFQQYRRENSQETPESLNTDSTTRSTYRVITVDSEGNKKVFSSDNGEPLPKNIQEQLDRLFNKDTGVFSNFSKVFDDTFPYGDPNDSGKKN
jgi:hypothetical protein